MTTTPMPPAETLNAQCWRILREQVVGLLVGVLVVAALLYSAATQGAGGVTFRGQQWQWPPEHHQQAFWIDGAQVYLRHSDNSLQSFRLQ